jgi:soluble lytic murein transglycosylase-like protein
MQAALLAVLIGWGLCLTPLQAEPSTQSAPGFGDFSFRRVTVGPSSGSKRITVQIDPEAQARRLRGAQDILAPASLDPEPQPLVPVTASKYDWFWQRMSADLGASGPGQLAEAVGALSQSPEGRGVPSPRVDALRALAEAHGVQILLATIGTQVSPALALAVIAVESGGRGGAISPKGAAGLMQLMPATAARFDVADRSDPAQNIKGGVAYLNWLMGAFDRDPLMVLAAYNAGENAVTRHGGVPPYPETRDYVPKVLAAWTVARGLCATPPELVSDGCVFRTDK